MSLAVQDFKPFLEEQRAGFGRELPALMREVESLWSRLERVDSRAGREQLRRLAHALAGCAGTYGYGHVGLTARRLALALEHGHRCDAVLAIARLRLEMPE